MHTLKDNTTVSQVNRIESTSESDMDSDEIEEVMQTLKVMKLCKQDCYSSCYKAKPNEGPCRNCSTEHPVGHCPANGKTCFGCGSINHFSSSSFTDIETPEWPGVQHMKQHTIKLILCCRKSNQQ